MTRDWSEIIRAAASKPLGIVALIILVIGTLAWGFFRKDESKIRFAAFALLVVGAGLLIAAVLREPAKESNDAGTGEPGAENTTDVPTVRTAVLPDLLNYVAIWEAVPKLRAAGFELPEIELTHDDNYIVKGRIAPPGIVIGVSDRSGVALNIGQKYPVDTHIRLRLQSDPSWNIPGRLLTDPSEVNSLVEFVQRMEFEAEQKHKGPAHLNR